MALLRRLALELLEDRRLLTTDLVNFVDDGVIVDPISTSDAGVVVPVDTRPYVPGEVVVAIRGETWSDSLSGRPKAADVLPISVAASITAEDPLLSTVDAGGSDVTLVKLDLADGVDVEYAIEQIESTGSVAWAAPNYIYEGEDPRDLIPNDARFFSQYHHPLMQTELAWDTTIGASSVIVAVTDDGIDLDHEDLEAGIWVNPGEVADDGIDNDNNGYIDDVHGWDFSSGDNDPNPENGTHGTHVAGIVGARINNWVGVVGTAPGVTIMPIRWYGSGQWTSTMIAESYAYAADNGAQIVSTSYSVDLWVGDPTFEAGLQYMYDQGVLHFNSAGNNTEKNPPRQVFEQSLFVASTDADDGISYYSNFGTGIDIAAPGYNIWSTLPENEYGTKRGTSMATPNAAGAAALIWSAHPDWSREQVAAQLVGTADNIDAVNPGMEGLLGGGRVNSLRAITDALPPPTVQLVNGIPGPGGSTQKDIDGFSIRPSQIIAQAAADDVANYELREAGGDGAFGTGDDYVFELARPSTYMVGTNEIDLEVVNGPLRVGSYRLTVKSGGIENPFGTALDGDHDDVAGGDYVHEFSIELAPFAAVAPQGSLVYALPGGGVVGAAGEADLFFVGVGPDQAITIVVDPASSLTASATVTGPGNFQASATASGAGERLVLHAPRTVLGGSYTVAIGGANGTTGGYAYSTYLNAAGELEAPLAHMNDTQGQAEDLTSSFVSLGYDAERRGAVVGTLDGLGDAQGDFYRFTLDDGESTTLVVSAEGGTGVVLDLYDADANRLATGYATANADQVIRGFRDTTDDGGDDWYFARVRGEGGTYCLVVTADADFDVELNSRTVDAQLVHGTETVLGNTRRSGGSGGADGGGGGESAGPEQVEYRVDDPDRVYDGESSMPAVAPDRMIIRFASSADQQEWTRELEAAGCELLEELPLIDAVVVRLPPDTSMDDALDFWNGHSEVVYAEPDFRLSIDALPNDPRFPELYGLHNTGAGGGVADADIDAPEVWDYFTGSRDVVVAVIDTGVDYAHEDLAANMWVNTGEIADDGLDNDGNGYVDDIHGIDVYNEDSDPFDDHSHGTHVSGTIAAVGNNARGVVGVNWQAQIMALKFLGAGGSGWISGAVEAVQYMTLMKTLYGVNVVVSNNSWGGGGFSQALEDAIRASNEAGILFAVAAGNSSRDIGQRAYYPASYDLSGIINVAATDRSDELATYSNFGAAAVDLAAPGSDVVSTTPGNNYGSKSGTSMATPHVAGAAAMLMAYDPLATVADVKSALMAGVDPLPGLADRVISGGRLNLVNSMTLIGDDDYYQFGVVAGDILHVSTATPGNSNLAFVNEVDPALELFDPDGTLVALDDNGGIDHRNASLGHIAEKTGIYRARVFSMSGQGEYVVSISGGTGPEPPLVVTGSLPVDGQVVGQSFPLHYTLQLSEGLLLSSVDPDDLTVGGRPALSVRVIDGKTLEFGVDPAANAGDGEYTVTLAAGSVTDVRGRVNDEFTATFFSDTTGPRITQTRWNQSDLPPAKVLPTGALAFEASFDQELMRFENRCIELTDLTRDERHYPLTLEFDPVASHVEVTYTDLPDGEFRVLLQSADGYLEDVVENNLDGEPWGPAIDGTPSGNGSPGGAYFLNFSLDTDVIPLPPLEPVVPRGGLIYETHGISAVGHAGDEDDFQLDLVAGTKLTAVVTPDVGLAPEIQIRDPHGQLVASISGTIGVATALQNVVIQETGFYSVIVSGAGGTTGGHELTVTVNASVEVDDTAAGSELLLNDSELTLGGRRMAVLGNIDSDADVDAYHVDLVAGTGIPLDIVVASRPGSEFAIDSLQLVAPDGTTVLQSGRTDPLGVPMSGVDLAILGFQVTQDGTYTVRVSAAGAAAYSLVVAESLVFETEPNDATDPVRSLDDTDYALGFIGTAPLPDVLYYTFDEGGGSQTHNFAVPGEGYADAPVEGLTLDGPGQFGTALAGNDGKGHKVDTGWTTSLGSESWTISFWIDRREIPFAGDPMYTMGDNSARSFRAFINGVAGEEGIYLRGPVSQVLVPGGAPQDAPAVVTWAYDAAASEIRAYANGVLVKTVPQYDLDITGSETFSVGAFHDEYLPIGTGGFMDEFRLYRRALRGWEPELLAQPMQTDVYEISFNAGQSVSLLTETPFAGLLGAGAELLDTELTVFGPTGAMIVSDKNSGANGRDSVASFLVPQTGVYRVHVTAGGGGGEYVLRMEEGERVSVGLDPAVISETEGAAATTGKVVRNTLADQDLQVTLDISDRSRITAPQSVTIPQGQSSASFVVDVADNATLDGTEHLIVTATALGHAGSSTTLTLIDHETISLTIAADTIAEGDGLSATTATVSRSNTDEMGTAVFVTLDHDSDVLIVPATVKIPAGQLSATFPIGTVDNQALDGTKEVIITATADGFIGSRDSVMVTDPVASLSGRVFEDLDADGVQDGGEAGVVGVEVYLDENDNGRWDDGEETVTTDAAGDYIFPRVPPGQYAVRQRLPDGWSATSPSVESSLYEMDFDELPLGNVPTQPKTDPLPLTKPTYAYASEHASVQVIKSVGDLSNQSLAFAVENPNWSGYSYGLIHLEPPADRQIGDYRVRWSSLLDGEPFEHQDIELALRVMTPAGWYIPTMVLHFTESGAITVEDGAGIREVGSYEHGRSDRFDLHCDSDNATYGLRINGGEVVEGSFIYPVSEVREWRFESRIGSRSPGVSPTLVVDDIQIEWIAADPGHTVQISGFPLSSHNFGIGQELSLNLAPDIVHENAGGGGAIGTLRRSSQDVSQPLEVFLENTHGGEAVVPTSVTIPAGEDSVQFDVDIVDDHALDGEHVITISATAAGHPTARETLTIRDHEQLLLSLSSGLVGEDSGSAAVTATLTRTNVDDLAAPQAVTLIGDYTDVLVVPESVEIPVGEASVTFPIDTMDNGVVDGLRTATIRAAADGFLPASIPLEVIDSASTISGRVFADYDGDGVQDAGEPGLSDVTVFLDVNDNDAWDTGETSSTTDTWGDYQLGGIWQARHVVRAVLPDGFLPTVPSLAEPLFDVNFNGQTLGRVDTQPGSDPLPLTKPTYASADADSRCEVVASSGNLTDQPVLLTASNPGPSSPWGYAEVVLDPSGYVVDGVLELTWKSLVTGEFDADHESRLFVQVPAGPTSFISAIDVGYDQTGLLYVREGGQYWIGEYQVGEADEFVLRLDFDTQRYALQLNDVDVREGSLGSSATELAYLTFNSRTDLYHTGTAPSWAIDDLHLDWIVNNPGRIVDADGSPVVGQNFGMGRPILIDMPDRRAAENEGAAALTGTIVRGSFGLSQAMEVALTTDDNSEAVVTPTVTIPAGQTTVDFVIDIVDDAVLDGRQDVTITAMVPGYIPGTRRIQVVDHETLTVSIAADQIGETAGPGATSVTISRSDVDDLTQPLVVDLVTDHVTVQVPANVEIPAGQASVTIPVDAVPDGVVEGPRLVVLMASADGYESGQDDLQVTEPAIIVAPLGLSTDAAEGGQGDRYTVVLLAQPTETVTVHLDTDAQADAWDAVNAGQAWLTFSPENWDVTQQVLVTAADDSLQEGPHATTIEHRVVSDDAGYDGLAVADMSVNLIDNDQSQPQSHNDEYVLSTDGPLHVLATEGVLANDTDADDDTLTAVVAEDPLHGDLTLAPDGSFTYLPHAGFRGLDIFTYVANDGISNAAHAATVTIRLEPPLLVRDINDAILDVSPEDVFEFGGGGYFTLQTATYGLELWRTDGTPEGTHIVKDIYPGETSSEAGNLVEYKGELYFTARDSGYYHLWKTDGTEAGTQVAADVRWLGSPGSVAVVGDLLFVTAYGSGTGEGTELWRSDGTTVGTSTVKDINPGNTSSYPDQLCTVGNTLYFVASDGVHGTELWKSDGTEAGTTMVLDVVEGSTSSSPEQLTGAGDTLYFVANHPSYGKELWASDGSPAGTRLVKDLRPGISTSYVTELTALGDKVYFRASTSETGSELFTSDGTEAGTVVVKDIIPGGASASAQYLVNAGGTLFFRANDGVNGTELWKTDGTAAGTQFVADIRPGSSSSYPEDLVFLDGVLYFSADDGVHGRELWISDGTAAGTRLMHDVHTGTGTSAPGPLLSVNGSLLFWAEDGINGRELWRHDESDFGTQLVVDLFRKTGDSEPDSLAAVGDGLFFSANDGVHGQELWYSDSAPAAATMVSDVYPGSGDSNPGYFAELDGIAYFQALGTGTGYELYRSDGTEAGTWMVADINPGGGSSYPSLFARVGQDLYFRAYITGMGYELFRTDGTEAGTFMVKEIYPGSSSSSPSNLTPSGDRCFFTATDGVHGTELWVTDGTAAGTYMVKDISPGALSASPIELADIDGILYFSASDGLYGRELWISDGTEAGTRMVADINAGTTSSSPMDLTNVDGTVFFRANHPSHSGTLYTTDGTAAGTAIVPLPEGRHLWWLSELTRVGDVVYFQAYVYGQSGRELYRSDGTTDGSYLVKDIAEGSADSSPSDLVNVDGILYFVANRPGYGRELYRSDGTTEGTVLVADIYPGELGAEPDDLAAVGHTLFFTADDGVTGRELWALPNQPPVIDLNGDAAGIDYSTTFVENAEPVSIAMPDAVISDVTSVRLTSLTARIVNRQDGVAERLHANVAATQISFEFDEVAGVLTLTGPDSIENFQQVLRSVTYENTAIYPDETPRTITVVASDGTAESETAACTVAVVRPTLTVKNLVPKASGFDVFFNLALDPAELNLYDVEAGTLGPADVTVVGATHGPVSGSLVAGVESVRFVAWGGVMPADSYTVTLRSADNAFKDVTGTRLLDGNGDGTPGDDYTTTFSTVPEDVVIGLPDFARGPGQEVVVPANAVGIPLTLTDNRDGGDGIRSVQVSIDCLPSRLEITDAVVGPHAPDGASVTIDTTAYGRVIVDFSSPTPLEDVTSHFVTLIADVPAGAEANSSHPITLTSPIVIDTSNAIVPASTDDALHAVAFFGDATGNGEYTGLDAQRVARVTVGLDSGFEAFPCVHPLIIGDVTGNGEFSGLDAQRIARFVVGLNPSEIPPLPPGQGGFAKHGATTPPGGVESFSGPAGDAEIEAKSDGQDQTETIADFLSLTPAPSVFGDNVDFAATSIPAVPSATALETLSTIRTNAAATDAAFALLADQRPTTSIEPLVDDPSLDPEDAEDDLDDTPGLWSPF